MSMSSEAVVVFTGEPTERIIEEGGTSAWHLDPKRAGRCTYAICARNARTDWGETRDEHRSAFLVGEVREVVPSRPATGKKRFSIAFARYAEVHISEAWPRNQNPVAYRPLDDLGIDLSTLKWKPLPDIPMRPMTPRKPRATK
jgi:hypothetical protein